MEDKSKDDWNTIIKNLKLDDLEKSVKKIAKKYDFKTGLENEDSPEKSVPLTPDYNYQFEDYLNTEEYETSGVKVREKKQVESKNYDLELFLTPEVQELESEQAQEEEEEEIQELCIRQETKDEKRYREFQKIFDYFKKKINENKNYKYDEMRQIIYIGRNGNLKYQKTFGPPVPSNQVIRQLYRKQKNSFRINKEILEPLVRKLSDRVFKFMFQKFPNIIMEIEGCDEENISQTRKYLIAMIYSAYHALYNHKSTTIAPNFPPLMNTHNYRFWNQFQEQVLEYVPKKIRYQWLMESEFQVARRTKQER